MASSWVDVWGTEANEDGLGEGFVSGVWEDRHGLCITFQRGFSVFIAYFQQQKPPICPARIIEIIFPARGRAWQNPMPRLIVMSLWQFRLRVTHHPIPPKHGREMHRTPTELSRNHDDFLPLIVPF